MVPAMTVAITGAARGIGRATAEAFVREGRQVAIGDVDIEEARRTAADLGDSAIALESRRERSRARFLEHFLDQAERELGRLQVLVNNAGIMSVGPFLEEDDATAQRMVNVNATGVLESARSSGGVDASYRRSWPCAGQPGGRFLPRLPRTEQAAHRQSKWAPRQQAAAILRAREDAPHRLSGFHVEGGSVPAAVLLASLHSMWVKVQPASAVSETL